MARTVCLISRTTEGIGTLLLYSTASYYSLGLAWDPQLLNLGLLLLRQRQPWTLR